MAGHPERLAVKFLSGLRSDAHTDTAVQVRNSRYAHNARSHSKHLKQWEALKKRDLQLPPTLAHSKSASAIPEGGQLGVNGPLRILEQFENLNTTVNCARRKRVGSARPGGRAGATSLSRPASSKGLALPADGRAPGCTAAAAAAVIEGEGKSSLNASEMTAVVPENPNSADESDAAILSKHRPLKMLLMDEDPARFQPGGRRGKPKKDDRARRRHDDESRPTNSPSNQSAGDEDQGQGR